MNGGGFFPSFFLWLFFSCLLNANLTVEFCVYSGAFVLPRHGLWSVFSPLYRNVNNVSEWRRCCSFAFAPATQKSIRTYIWTFCAHFGVSVSPCYGLWTGFALSHGNSLNGNNLNEWVR